MKPEDWTGLLVTLGLLAAGVLVVALLVDWTMRKYVILQPAVPDKVPEDMA